MPTVPRYDTPQVAQTSLPQPGLKAPDMPDVAGRQGQMLGIAMQKIGGEVGRIADDLMQEANKDRVDDGMNQLVKARTDMLSEALKLRGRNAVYRPSGDSLPDEYTKKLKEVEDKIHESLGNDVQRQAFRHSAAQIKQHLYDSLSSHMVAQQREFRKERQLATISVAVDQGVLLYGDEAMRKQSLSTIANTIDEIAVDEGWDKTVKEAELAKAVSPLHAGIMKSMIQGGMASKAREYYDANSASMTLQARATMQGVLKEAGDSQIAEEKADAIWAELGPKGVNDAVPIFDMEQAMRERLKGNPDAMKKGIDSLRQRAQAINAQQTEMKAKNIAGVWGLIDSGVPMRDVHRSDAWLSLTDTERHALRKQLQRESAELASNELTIMQRNERLNFLRNGDKFLDAISPDYLINVSREQVKALRGEIGIEATKLLLDKWETIRKPGKLIEARIDKEDFDVVADRLGLKPFARNLNEEQKRNLGTLKYRIEQLIDIRQRDLGRPMDRQEKMDFMSKEMAKTVTVNPGWYTANETVPVVQLTEKQIKNVVIPKEERAAIVEALKAMNARYPNDPRYFPNEENLRRTYIRGVSSAGGLIKDGK